MFFRSLPSLEQIMSWAKGQDKIVIYYDLDSNNVGIFYRDTLKTLLTDQGKKDFIYGILIQIQKIYHLLQKYKIRAKLVFFYNGTFKSLIGSYNTMEDKMALEEVKKLYRSLGTVLSRLINIYFVRNHSNIITPLYYVQHRVFSSNVNIILSNNKRYIPTLEFSGKKYGDTLIGYRYKKEWYAINKDNWLTKFWINEELDIRHFKHLVAIVGERHDSFSGVRGIGWKTIVKVVKEIDFTDEEMSSTDLYVKKLIQKGGKLGKVIDLYKDVIKNNSYNIFYPRSRFLDNALKIEKLSFNDSLKELSGLYEYVGNKI